ncbi:MAG TPA: exopolysaccharide biosynthesis polyprenyl glycosylphosphotransferase [Gaiellaceae bacterium]
MPRSAVAPVVDLVVLTVAVVAESAGARTLSSPVGSSWVFFFPPLAVAALAAGGLYRSRLGPDLLDELRAIAGATAIAAMTTTALAVAGGKGASAAVEMSRLWVFSTVYVAAVRSGVLSPLFGQRRSVPTLIVGAGTVGQLVAKRLAEHPGVGLDVVGYLDGDPRPLSAPALPVLGSAAELGRVLEQHRIEHVVFAFSRSSHDTTLQLIDECGRRGVRVTLVPRLFERLPRNVTVDYIGALPFLSLYPNEPGALRFRLKYGFDRVVAAALIVVLSPVLVAVGLGVAFSAGTPILFRQPRLGRDGRVFTMLKFRTMRGGAATHGDPARSVTVGPGGVEGVDRRTPFGRFLRRTSLDELPQLFNVLRGDMSLVGPRPERPDLAEVFREHVARYGERQRLKSGMTGWAQIHGLRGKTSLADRIEWDNWYIENCSPWLDLKILLGTARSLIGVPQAE